MLNLYSFQKYIIYSFVFCLPFLTLFARSAHEESHEEGNHNKAAYSHHNQQYNNYNNHKYSNQNFKTPGGNPSNLYGPHGNNYGNYGGGGGYTGTPYPYPTSGSQPGMSDDSNALYKSQLQNRGEGYL